MRVGGLMCRGERGRERLAQSQEFSAGFGLGASQPAEEGTRAAGLHGAGLQGSQVGAPGRGEARRVNPSPANGLLLLQDAAALGPAALRRCGPLHSSA